MSNRIITFGKWNEKPIRWIVLKEENFGTLVLCEDGLMDRIFDKKSGRWDKSDIRKFLNQDFFSKAFSEEEQKKVVNVYLEEPNQTKDDVFLLSKADFLVGQEMGLIPNCGAYSTHNCSGIGCSDCYRSRTNNHSSCWWLRTLDGVSQVIFVNGCGGIESYNIGTSVSVRPAMYIRE
ncbi:MAG: DUF6273 domain-containing protein [Lachnospiraceae bacterium]